MADETSAETTNATDNSGGEPFAPGVERVGEAGVVLRMDFPHNKVREDFLIAFRGWLKQYKQSFETAYLVQALVAERAAAAADEDTAGYFWGLLQGGVFAPIYFAAHVAVAPTRVQYSDWMPW